MAYKKLTKLHFAIVVASYELVSQEQNRKV